MAREVIISVTCNPCQEIDGKKTPAEVALVAVHVSDPQNPGKVKRVIKSIDVCEDHKKEINELLGTLDKFGMDFEDEECHVLLRAVRSEIRKEKRTTDTYLCFDCTIPVLLKENSLYTHAREVHDGKKKEEADFRQFDPKVDRLRVEIV